METRAEGKMDKVEAFLAELAEGTLDLAHAIERAYRLKDLLEDSLKTQEYPLPLPDGTKITMARKSQPEMMSIESQLERINDWIARNDIEENAPTCNGVTTTTATPILPITWRGDKAQASIGWLFRVLIDKGYIDCSATTFYQHFVDQKGKSIKGDAESSRKSREPGSHTMKALVCEIRRHED